MKTLLRGVGWIFAWLVMALVLAFIGLPFVGELPFYLLFGWLLFLVKTLPEVRIDWASTGLAIVALVLLVVGIQKTGAGWMSRRSPAAEIPAGRTWYFRWTVVLVASLLVAFTAGISVLGVVHQFVWLAGGSEPFLDSDHYEFVGRTQSKNNLKQIGLAIHDYADHNGVLPPGATFDGDGQPMHSVMTFILPYIDQQALFSTIDRSKLWNHADNRTAFATAVETYRFPEGVPNPGFIEQANGYALTNYAGNVHVLQPGHSLTVRDIGDGTSNTILFGEVMEDLRPWGDPLNLRDPSKGINKGASGYSSPFHHGANVLLADGSVTFVSEKTDPEILKALSTPNGGELAGEY